MELHVLGQSEQAKRLRIVEPDHGTYHPTAAARAQLHRVLPPPTDLDKHTLTLAQVMREQAERRRRRAHAVRTLVLLAVGAAVGASLTFFATGARGADWHLIGHGISHHTGTRAVEQETRVHTFSWDGSQTEVTHDVAKPYNERNWGLGVRAELSPAVSVQGGYYRNSYDRVSGYLLADWTPLRAGPVAAGLFAGLVNNYPHNDHRIGASGGLLARAQVGRFSTTLRYVPKVSPKQTGHTAALELGWRV